MSSTLCPTWTQDKIIKRKFFILCALPFAGWNSQTRLLRSSHISTGRVSMSVGSRSAGGLRPSPKKLLFSNRTNVFKVHFQTTVTKQFFFWGHDNFWGYLEVPFNVSSWDFQFLSQCAVDNFFKGINCGQESIFHTFFGLKRFTAGPSCSKAN